MEKKAQVILNSNRLFQTVIQWKGEVENTKHNHYSTMVYLNKSMKREDRSNVNLSCLLLSHSVHCQDPNLI